MPIVLATTTFYGGTDKVRFKLAQQLIENARTADCDVVIVDNSPLDIASEIFEGLGATVKEEICSGMGPSRRQAFFLALECLHRAAHHDLDDSVIIWTEPEKADIVNWLAQIIAPIESNQADIVIPSRTDASWKTYPEFQITSERACNIIYANNTRRQGFDPMFGPVAFRASTLARIMWFNPQASRIDVPDNYIQHYLPLLVPACRVASVPIDFVYPAAQRAEEERTDNEAMQAKRAAQKSELIKAYHSFGQAAWQNGALLIK